MTIYYENDDSDPVTDSWLNSYEQVYSGMLTKINEKYMFCLPRMNFSSVLYEAIDYLSFPSSCDYFGETICVDKDTTMLILNVENRPINLAWGKENIAFGSLGCDICKVLVEGKAYHVLRAWIEIIE